MWKFLERIRPLVAFVAFLGAFVGLCDLAPPLSRYLAVPIALAVMCLVAALLPPVWLPRRDAEIDDEDTAGDQPGEPAPIAARRAKGSRRWRMTRAVILVLGVAICIRLNVIGLLPDHVITAICFALSMFYIVDDPRHPFQFLSGGKPMTEQEASNRASMPKLGFMRERGLKKLKALMTWNGAILLGIVICVGLNIATLVSDTAMIVTILALVLVLDRPEPVDPRPSRHARPVR